VPPELTIKRPPETGRSVTLRAPEAAGEVGHDLPGYPGDRRDRQETQLRLARLGATVVMSPGTRSAVRRQGGDHRPRAAAQSR